MTKSEFGRGLCYNLGLFLAHERQFEELRKRNTTTSVPNKIIKFSSYSACWFNASSDHLYEIQALSAPTKYLQKRIQKFASKCLLWGHGFDPEHQPKDEDVEWAIKEAKTLLRLIDKANGVPTIKGEWE